MQVVEKNEKKYCFEQIIYLTNQQKAHAKFFVKTPSYRSYEKCREPFILKTKKQPVPSFHELWQPAENIFISMPPLEAQGNRPLQMNFEHQLKALVFFHLEEHTSGRHLLQVLEEDDFDREVIAPPEGIKKSSFFEAINSRGLEQLTYVFQRFQVKVANILPKEHAELGNLVAIDSSLIDAVLSMQWADYRKDCRKAKVHIGFNMNQSIPSKIFLTDGKTDERPFVRQILSSGQTTVMDRYYPCHKDFDLWQTEGKSFVCRIRENTKKTCIKSNPVKPGTLRFLRCNCASWHCWSQSDRKATAGYWLPH